MERARPQTVTELMSSLEMLSYWRKKYKTLLNYSSNTSREVSVCQKISEKADAEMERRPSLLTFTSAWQLLQNAKTLSHEDTHLPLIRIAYASLTHACAVL